MIKIPKVAFSSENKIKTNNDYPILKLDHDERALILAIEPQPEMAFVHELNAPEIGPDGRVLKEVKIGKRGEYQKVKTEFIGKHLCFGNFDILSQKGVDPEACPTCAAAVEGEGIDAPKARYAMHVVRYALQPGSWQLKNPFSVSLEVWSFPANKFNLLVDIAQEWGDLRKHDLKLGPCENAGFQKFEIHAASKAEWLLNDERKQRVAEEYKNNKTDDLIALIARRIDKGQALEDIARVKERIAQAYGHSVTDVAAPLAKQTAAVIDDDIADLLGDSTPKKETSNVPDPFSPATENETSSTVEVDVVKETPEVQNSSSLSFDDLMNNL